MLSRRDFSKLALAGLPVPLGAGAAVTDNFGNFSASDNGPLVYLPAGRTPPFELVWFDRKGARLSTLAGVWTPPFLDYPANLSPDQKSVAFVHRESTKSDIWLFDAASGVRTRLTVDSAKDTAPVWSPDSHTVVFACARKGHFDLYRRAAYGATSEQLLYADASEKYPTSWSHDGKYLLYDRAGDDVKAWSIWVLPLSTTGNDRQCKPFPLPQAAEKARRGQFSPDGRWVAYESEESGRPEIYLCPFNPDASSRGWKRQISTGQGKNVRWRNDGREIFYISGRRLLAATLDITRDTVRVIEERQVIGPLSILRFDVSADGERFLVRTRTQQLVSQPLTVVQNWTTAFRR
jgi:Tol biopolymer transport system component